MEHLIIDSDVGGDDLFSMLLFLMNSKKVKIHMISTIRGLRIDFTETVQRLEHMFSFYKEKGIIEEVPIIKAGNFKKQAHCFTEMDMIFKDHNDFFNGGKNTKHEKSFEERFFGERGSSAKSDVEEHESGKEMKKLILSHPPEFFTLLCIGPLTNIAELLSCNESDTLIQRFKKIVIMGSGIQQSNVYLESSIAEKNDSTEWNWYCDPPAVDIVLKKMKENIKKNKYFICPIESSFTLTCFERVKKEVFNNDEKENNNNNRNRELFYNVMKSLVHWNPVCSCYDSIVGASLLEPSLIQYEPMNVSIVTKPKKKEGMAIMTPKKKNEKENILVGVSFDEDKYIAFLKSQFQ